MAGGRQGVHVNQEDLFLQTAVHKQKNRCLRSHESFRQRGIAPKPIQQPYKELLAAMQRDGPVSLAEVKLIIRLDEGARSFHLFFSF